VPRPDGRANNELRPVVLERRANPYAEGSCLIRAGGTLVYCTASVEAGVPAWRKDSGLGWVTAEYAMLPRSTTERTRRERSGAGGRTQEIQRLIGRAMRAVVDTTALGERTFYLDCDVIQADGGTRTAAINGSFIALVDALRKVKDQKRIRKIPVQDYLAAVSVGIVDVRADIYLLDVGQSILVSVLAGIEPVVRIQPRRDLILVGDPVPVRVWKRT